MLRFETFSCPYYIDLSPTEFTRVTHEGNTTRYVLTTKVIGVARPNDFSSSLRECRCWHVLPRRKCDVADCWTMKATETDKKKDDEKHRLLPSTLSATTSQHHWAIGCRKLGASFAWLIFCVRRSAERKSSSWKFRQRGMTVKTIDRFERGSLAPQERQFVW